MNIEELQKVFYKNNEVNRIKRVSGSLRARGARILVFQISVYFSNIFQNRNL